MKTSGRPIYMADGSCKPVEKGPTSEKACDQADSITADIRYLGTPHRTQAPVPGLNHPRLDGVTARQHLPPHQRSALARATPTQKPCEADASTGQSRGNRKDISKCSSYVSTLRSATTTPSGHDVCRPQTWSSSYGASLLHPDLSLVHGRCAFHPDHHRDK